MVVEIEHPQGGSYRAAGNPIKLSETHEDMFTPPPLVGQHTDEVLGGLLGLSRAEIAALRAEGIV
jgi:crotonobetainyl-CoA:carnitine CoA-transferase CaiB-like acyl-CoA transferase